MKKLLLSIALLSLAACGKAADPALTSASFWDEAQTESRAVHYDALLEPTTEDAHRR